CLQGYIPPYSF
nr:immunoglobulin light chain junction region [Macaca mulatta]MOV84364.1 immunoglobulin light chain junction region [Macaca mulatta]